MCQLLHCSKVLHLSELTKLSNIANAVLVTALLLHFELICNTPIPAS